MSIDVIMQAVDIELKKRDRSRAPDRSQWSATAKFPVLRAGTDGASVSKLQRIKRLVYRLPLVGGFARWALALLRLHVRLEQLGDDQALVRIDMQRLAGYDFQLTEKVLNTNSRLDLVLSELSEMRRQFRNAAQQVQVGSEAPAAGASTPGLDSVYLAFEERFRKSDEQLLASFAPYDGVIRDVKSRLPEGRCIDVGCGRGEWLSYVRDRGLATAGVDLNQSMVDAAKDRGIEAVCQDGISYLSSLEADSLAMVSAFHVVEHLPTAKLIHLIDESFRVLMRGGVAIFETPNPENILVGSCNFYTDPTHLNPIPPHTLDFLVIERGFERTTVLRKGQAESDLESQDQAVNYMLQWFKKEPDYAIIAYKS